MSLKSKMEERLDEVGKALAEQERTIAKLVSKEAGRLQKAVSADFASVLKPVEKRLNAVEKAMPTGADKLEERLDALEKAVAQLVEIATAAGEADAPVKKTGTK